MKNGTLMDFRNPAVVRKTGMSALNKSLGVAGTSYFIRQFSAGNGNYTKDRNEYLKDISLNDVFEAVREFDARV